MKEEFYNIDWTKEITSSDFDSEYFSNIVRFFSSNKGRAFCLTGKNKQLQRVTENYRKFVAYIKYYIDCKIKDPEFPYFAFSDDFTILYVN